MIQVAIIGTGAVANTHIESFLKFKHKCQVIAVADQDLEKAEQKAQRYGLDAAIYDDYEIMLEKEDIDLVANCTPPFVHAPASIAALNAGAHVLVEKPMATSLAECDAMIAAAHANNKLLSVVAQNRYKTPMMRLKKVLESGLTGKIVHAQVDSFWWRGPSYYDLWWRGTWEQEGGGCTMSHAVHHIDLYQWMMGMPDEIQAVITNLAHENSEVEDFSNAVLTYQDGRLGQITASLVHHGEKQQLMLQGERATVAVPWKVSASTQKDNGFPEHNPALEREIQAYYQGLPEVEHVGHDGQIATMLAAVEGEAELLIDGAEGRKTLELVMAIYQSGTTGKRVKLPMTPQDPFYTRQGVLENAPHFHEKTKSVRAASEDITFGSDYEEEAS